jgi:hypothetical protein
VTRAVKALATVLANSELHSSSQARLRLFATNKLELLPRLREKENILFLGAGEDCRCDQQSFSTITLHSRCCRAWLWQSVALAIAPMPRNCDFCEQQLGRVDSSVTSRITLTPFFGANLASRCSRPTICNQDTCPNCRAPRRMVTHYHHRRRQTNQTSFNLNVKSQFNRAICPAHTRREDSLDDFVAACFIGFCISHNSSTTWSVYVLPFGS